MVSASSHGVHASLQVEDPAPAAGDLRYDLLATKLGKPLAGTVVIEFLPATGGAALQPPATHPLKNGRLSGTVSLPAQPDGTRLALRFVVHTAAGTVTLNWIG